jgi:hypothetical protein
MFANDRDDVDFLPIFDASLLRCLLSRGRLASLLISVSQNILFDPLDSSITIARSLARVDAIICDAIERASEAI